MQKIRVIQITHDLNIGGLQRVAADLAQNLNKDRYDVSVCALREGGVLEQELSQEGISVIKLPPAPNGVDYFSFWKLYQIFKAVRPDIIHTHNTQPFLEGALAGLMARVPVIIHTDHGRQFPDKKRYMFAEQTLARFVSQIVAVSEFTKNDLIQYEKIKASKIKVVLNGIDGRKYSCSIDKIRKKKEAGIDRERGPIIGWCGRLSPEKGLSFLFKSVKSLVKVYPEIILLIAGEGPLEERLRIEAKELGIERNILFLGRREDVHEIMSIFDIFVLPSIREGLPLVLLEAMAASLPIIASDVGGISRAVKEGINGFLVKPQDPDILYERIKNLLENAELREVFARNAQALFQKEFSLERMIREYETVYQECLALAGFESGLLSVDC
ncbi:MAG: glycosyltransferase family 4 protein [Nitrospiria bacterium]